LATTQQFGDGGQTDVFLVDRFGQLQAFWKVGSGDWNGPVGLGPTGFAPPGAYVAASQQIGVADQTDVFVVDQSGQLAVFWIKGSAGWNGPLKLGPAGFAPAGAPIAVSQQFGADNQTNVYVVDDAGQLNVFWANNGGSWFGPAKIGPAGLHLPGAHIAASQQFGALNQTDVFVVDKTGRLNVFWVQNAGAWNGPEALSTAGFAASDGALAATQQFGAPNQTDVVLVDAKGQVSVFWVNDAGAWQGPQSISFPGFAPPGAPMAASPQFGVANQTDVFSINNAGQPSAFWVQSTGPWNGPTVL
jgi:hypothetical protein